MFVNHQGMLLHESENLQSQALIYMVVISLQVTWMKVGVECVMLHVLWIVLTVAIDDYDHFAL